MIKPVFVATWPFGVAACEVGWDTLASGSPAIDAIEAAGNVTEEDPAVNSVGYGGLPNREGVVELDAAIMEGLTHRAGAVGGITGLRMPISIARRVMEVTPHVMLVGENARRFAIQHGFREGELLTDVGRERWAKWKEAQVGAEVAHFDVGPRLTAQAPSAADSHDTIGLCALDSAGNLAVGCTTSGMAWKVPGRVGDSPIIGSGLYVDNEIGGAAATGHGDEMMKACVSYRVVMLMERGLTAEEACAETIRYLMRKRPTEPNGNYGAALIAIRKDGDFGAASTLSGFYAPDRKWRWAVHAGAGVELREGPYISPDQKVCAI